MDIKRYVIVQAVKTVENELIPIWDERLVFDKTEMYGDIIYIKNDYRQEHQSLVECVFDLKTKKMEIGIELNYYPSESELDFKKGEVILFEKSMRVLQEAKIADIVFEQYEMEIKRGRKLDKWWIDRFKNVKIDGNILYAIKQWKPFYILDNGVKIEWGHQLYHKEDKNILQ